MLRILEVHHLHKSYSTEANPQRVHVLNDVNMTVDQGEFVAIMGESGSGKSTLLHILALYDQPTSGEVRWNGTHGHAMKEKEIAAFRIAQLGFVFQEFHLIDTFTLQDNIILPLVVARVPYMEMNKRLEPLASQLGISHVLNRYPHEVSGGEQQRAAIARALITNRQLIFADEPTGALDAQHTKQLLHLFVDLHARGQTLFMVTHSARVASYAHRILFLQDGHISYQLYRGNASNEVMYHKISDALNVFATGGNPVE